MWAFFSSCLSAVTHTVAYVTGAMTASMVASCSVGVLAGLGIAGAFYYLIKNKDEEKMLEAWERNDPDEDSDLDRDGW